MSFIDVVNIIDRLDVWGLAALCGWGFYKLIMLIKTVTHSLDLVEQRLTLVDEKLENHMEYDYKTHERFDHKIDEVILGYGHNRNNSDSVSNDGRQ